MLNLDPKIVDQETVRKQRRKKLFIIYAAPVAILLIIAGFFLSTTIFNVVYDIEYNGRAFGAAGSLSNTRLFINVLEPYLAYYDRGVTELQNKQYTKAEESFNEALQNSPSEERLCMIYVNLSLSIEYQADQALSGKNYEQAIVLYNRAEATLYNNGCASKSGNNSKDSKAAEAKIRIEKKRSDTIDAINNTIDGSGGTSETGDNQHQVTGEEVQKIIDKRIPSNQLRGNLNINSYKCSPLSGNKCY